MKNAMQLKVIPLKLDITMGEKITPKEIEYKFNQILSMRRILRLRMRVMRLL